MWADDDTEWSMLEILRLSRETATVPIVLCTGTKRQVSELGDHLTLRNFRVIPTPFDVDDLLGVIVRALEARSA